MMMVVTVLLFIFNFNMLQFLKKIGIYSILIVVMLELLVRVFHLYTEDPPRFIDEFNVEKRIPGYTGYSVTGNRRQNFSRFNINAQGFNSYRAFTPTRDKIELALIGDSFIQGFHEDFDNSIGRKIEERTLDIAVYEYGYAGWDMADQLHLLHAYKTDFDKIDYIIIYMDYATDLNRDAYEPNVDRIALLNSFAFRLRRKIKLLYYASEIGVLDAFRNFISGKKAKEIPILDSKDSIVALNNTNYIKNFKNLLQSYPINKSKTYFLLDERKTSPNFIDFCKEQDIKLIDFGASFNSSKKPTDLTYDQHWNNHGRSILATLIAKKLSNKAAILVNE